MASIQARSSAAPTCVGHRCEVAGDRSIVDGNHANHGVCNLQCTAKAFEHSIALIRNIPHAYTMYMQVRCEHEVAIRKWSSVSVHTLWNAQNERSKWTCIIVMLAPCSGLWSRQLHFSRSAALRMRGLPCHHSTSGCWTAGLPDSCMLFTHLSSIRNELKQDQLHLRQLDRRAR